MRVKKFAFSEMFILILSVVAVSYLIGMTNPVSAQTQDSGVSCCSQRNDGAPCLPMPTYECSSQCSGNCVPGPCEGTTNTLCASGCCIDESSGTCATRTPQNTCTSEGGIWKPDSQCQVSQCKKACCILGTNTKFVTENECKILSKQKGFDVDFNPGITTEMECLAKAYTIEEGACIIGTGIGKTCRFVSGKECNKLKGHTFRPGLLCTAPSIGICKPTKETKYVEGRDKVYFKDSCENHANIYDASKIDNVDYWTRVYKEEESCKAEPDSKTCGNCDRFANTRYATGKAEHGNLICKDLSCVDENGKKRENDESWCVYDGSIGDGEDIVGSKHWLRSCVLGEIKTEGCGRSDFRTEICVQNDFKRDDGTTKSSANCRINRAKECIAYNTNKDETEKEKMEKCGKNSDCQVMRIDVDEGFKFNFCAPKYPLGLDQRTEGGQQDTESLCRYANQKCTVVYEKKLSGWECVQNCDCETREFTEKINKLCTSLGDCGFKINVAGDTDDAYSVIRAPRLGGNEYIGSNVPDKIPASPGNLSEFLPSLISDKYEQAKYREAFNYFAGISGSTGALVGIIAGISGGAEFLGLSSLLQGGPILVFSQSAPGFATFLAGTGNALVGAALGAIVGLLVSKAFGLSGDAVLVTTITGAVTGAILGILLYVGVQGLNLFGAGVILIIVIVLVALIMKLFKIGETRKRIAEFNCQPWQAPTGGDKCKLCGKEDGKSDFKECSRYRCESLGQTCEFINEGTGKEACIDMDINDVSPPQIKPYKDIFPEGYSYESVSENGFAIKKNEKCIDTFDPVIFGITTNERARCRIDIEPGKSFDEMNDFGESRLYKENHLMSLFVPSTEAILNDYFGGLDECKTGEEDNCLTKDDIAQIKELENKLRETLGNTNLYVKCQDRRGNKNYVDFVIRTCVNQEPDETAPAIIATNPANERVIMFNVTEQEVKISTNEPAECRWSKSSGIEYEQMKDNFVCDNSEITSIGAWGYECDATLPIVKGENKFYFRCKDKPFETDITKRVANDNDYVYTITTSNSPLEIVKLKPDGNVIEGKAPAQVKLEVETKGGADDGKAECEWTFGGNVRDFFFPPYVTTHSYSVNLFSGDYTLTVSCKDRAGNSAEKSQAFTLTLDTTPPQVLRAFKSSNNLKIITDEDAECRISNDCNFANGKSMSGTRKEHTTPWNADSAYNIICKDIWDNYPADCSIKIKGIADVV